MIDVSPRPVHTGLAALGWMSAFFAMLWLLGAWATVPLFALAYLLAAARESPVWPEPMHCAPGCSFTGCSIKSCTRLCGRRPAEHL